MNQIISKKAQNINRDNFLLKLIEAYVLWVLGFTFFTINELALGRMVCRLLFTLYILFILFQKIEIKGLLKFKWLILSIVLDVLIATFFAFPDFKIFTTIGAYAYIVPKVFLLYHIYKINSNRENYPIKTMVVNSIILVIVLVLSYLFIIDLIYDVVIFAGIINLTLLSIILGLSFLLSIPATVKYFYIFSNVLFLVTVLLASNYYFTPSVKIIFILPAYTNALAYLLLVLAMYYQNKEELEGT